MITIVVYRDGEFVCRMKFDTEAQANAYIKSLPIHYIAVEEVQ